MPAAKKSPKAARSSNKPAEISAESSNETPTSSPAAVLSAKAAAQINAIHRQDCIAGMKALGRGVVDLVFADPPFNIGFDYDVYQDKKETPAYLKWSRQWIAGVYDVLKPTGSFWLAIGDEYAAELKVISQEIGFHARSWVIWYYTFGVNCANKFTRSHAHLFYFVKDPEHFTFRGDYLENRIPSARQLVYGDHRANPAGRLPDDTWVLRPQDLADCFTPVEDTWYIPRVAGTFKERAGFHGCQMPEQLLGRIIRVCSSEGEIVLDPFSGSATTVAVAKKLGRRYCAFDLSEEYIQRGRDRLKGICVGDPLDGSAEPTVSAPNTAAGVRIENGQRVAIPKTRNWKKNVADHEASKATATDDAGKANIETTLYERALLAAYEATYDGYSLDRMVADPELNARFIAECAERSLPGDARSWNWSLFRLRKSGHLTKYPAIKRTEISWDDCDDYLFASEIAWHEIIGTGKESLDSILCDPELAKRFDKVASMWAPNFSPLQYRWAALKLRKSANEVRTRANTLSDTKLRDRLSLDDALRSLPDSPGVYLVNQLATPLYAGESADLRKRIARQFIEGTEELWQARRCDISIDFASYGGEDRTNRQAYQRRLVARRKPRLNLLNFSAR